MNRYALISLVAAALGMVAAPSAFAGTAIPLENDGVSYLSTRQHMDQPAAIARVLERIDAGQQFHGVALEPRDFLAERKSLYSIDGVNGIYRDVEAGRALAGRSMETAPAYLATRKNLYSAESLDRAFARTGVASAEDKDEVGQL